MNETSADKRQQLRHWIAEVVVEPKPGVNDPQGEAILGGLRSLGYDGVGGVRSGRFFRLRLAAPDSRGAEAALAAMCEQLLANPVIETYTVTIVEDFPEIDVTDEAEAGQGARQ